MLRLKSESSAFQDLASPRASRAQTTMEQKAASSGFSYGARDRSSSHESTTSSTSHSDDVQHSSERRRSVRELADSINRKHKQSKNPGASNLPRVSKVMTPVKQSTNEVELYNEKQQVPDDSASDRYKTYDGLGTNTKPISLIAASAIERRGTVERHRENLKYGTQSFTPHSRKHNLQQKPLAEETHDLPGKRNDPRISPFMGQSHATRAPARGILKNASAQNSPVRVVGKSVSTNRDLESLATTDSGLGNDLSHENLSFLSGSRSSKSLYSSQLTSPETEFSLDRSALYEYDENSKYPANRAQDVVTTKSSRRRRPNKSASNHDINVEYSESPSFFQFDDPEDTPSTSTFHRCPSAPAATFLAENSGENRTLFPIKDDSLLNDTTTDNAVNAHRYNEISCKRDFHIK